MGERSRFPNKEISILSLRQHLLLSERSFTLVNDGGELVKIFRSGGDELRGLGVSGLLLLTEWGWVFLDLWCCSDASTDVEGGVVVVFRLPFVLVE